MSDQDDQDDYWERAEASEMMADELDDVTAERDDWKRRALEAEKERDHAIEETNALRDDILARGVALGESQTIARVVAWLREQANLPDNLSDEPRSFALELAADAIERGEWKEKEG